MGLATSIESADLGEGSWEKGSALGPSDRYRPAPRRRWRGVVIHVRPIAACARARARARAKLVRGMEEAWALVLGSVKKIQGSQVQVAEG